MESRRAQREAVVNAHVESEAVITTWRAALAKFHHPRYEVPPRWLIADGSEAVEQFLIGFLSAFPDLWLRKLALQHADGAVIVECVFGGTNLGPLGEIAATGKNAGAGCLDFHLRGGPPSLREGVL